MWVREMPKLANNTALQKGRGHDLFECDEELNLRHKHMRRKA